MFDRRRFKFQRDFCIERDVEFVSTVSEQIKKRLELLTESWSINFLKEKIDWVVKERAWH